MVARFTPPTPRSRRLGRELRTLREQHGYKLDQVAEQLRCSPSRISRIESGEIKSRPGDVMELLDLYSVEPDSEQARLLLDMARELREPGWWQRLGALSQRYLTYIGFEAEATDMHNFEPTLVPGLLQTEAYARAVISIGRETEAAAIGEFVNARMRRQEVLTRDNPLRLWAILSEAVLLCEVGGRETLQTQLRHLAEVSSLPNVTIQVLPFAAGAHFAIHGGFAVLSLGPNDPSLGYIETLAGELFLESQEDVGRLNAVYDHLRMLSLSPAESVRLIQERSS